MLVIVLTVWLCFPLGLMSSEPEAKPPAQSDSTQDIKNRLLAWDLKVVTHEGEELRFYSDILKDKLVVIGFIYTECPTAQPALMTFFRLQKRFGDRLGKDIMLLTISVDPEIDTPEVVRKYASQFNPQKGRLFLTGTQENMNNLNRKLGNKIYSLPEGHLRLFLLGNVKTGHWMRIPETAHDIAVEEGLLSLEE